MRNPFEAMGNCIVDTERWLHRMYGISASNDTLTWIITPEFKVEMLRHKDSIQYTDPLKRTAHGIRYVEDTEQEEEFRLVLHTRRMA